ncbi:hypothetical protein OIO90_003225 [Microbotryomycetes sp. JL221]|nr:hypothetical protein OIO90_003225 [Microbotryomycetes sp. JL221]
MSTPTQALLHQPNTLTCNVEELVPLLLGEWRVSVASTLPLWKDKKNVVIEYNPVKGEASTTLDDLVSYNKRSDKPGTKASTVHGVDRFEGTLRDSDQAAQEQSLTGGPRWKWRGKGWLVIASSHWQVLGHNLTSATQSSSTEPQWVVTYFASTLFTPAGLDIYTRQTLDDDVVAKLTRELEGLGGEVAELCKDGKMFRIPHDE